MDYLKDSFQDSLYSYPPQNVTNTNHVDSGVQQIHSTHLEMSTADCATGPIDSELESLTRQFTTINESTDPDNNVVYPDEVPIYSQFKQDLIHPNLHNNDLLNNLTVGDADNLLNTTTTRFHNQPICETGVQLSNDQSMQRVNFPHDGVQGYTVYSLDCSGQQIPVNHVSKVAAEGMALLESSQVGHCVSIPILPTQ